MKSILTWHRGYRDHYGGSPRVRPVHCTSDGLTLAISPKRGELGCIICGSGGLRSRYPPNNIKTKVECSKVISYFRGGERVVWGEGRGGVCGFFFLNTIVWDCGCESSSGATS